jgi:hypothetical protein
MSQFVSLLDQVAFDQVECLNEDADHPVRNLFGKDSTKYLSSDIDPQLIISIPFQNPVKLSGLKLSFRDDQDAIPSCVKLFTNRVSLGFGDAENLAPLQVISRDELLTNEVVPLRYVLFQNVVSLQIFVEDNMGAEKTEIASVDILGTLGESMNMKEFKKIKDDE